MLKALPLLLLLSAVSFAETITYVVYRQKCFPNDKYATEVSPHEQKLFVDAGKKTLAAAGGQPFRLTLYALNFDGKYAEFHVDDENSPDRGYFRHMEANGCAVVISTQEVVSQFDPIRGGKYVLPINTYVHPYPTDFYRVDGSTE